MKGRWSPGALVLLILGLCAAAPKGKGTKADVFAPLEAGQRVSLRERAGGFEIGIVPGVPLGYRVVEVGVDHVVLEDAASWSIPSRRLVSSASNQSRNCMPYLRTSTL